jgi:hypothetical protein
MKYTAFLTFFGLLALPAVSSAAVSATHSYSLQDLGTPYAVSSTDLINSGQPTLSSSTTNYTPFNASSSYGDAEVLTDGIATGDNSFRTLPDNLQGFTSTYILDTSANTFGYTISGISTYAGNGDSRARQEYQVLYRQVGSTDFVRLVPEDFTSDRTDTQPFQTNNSTNGGDLGGGDGGETELNIVINDLTGVDAIRFVTQPASGNSEADGASVYREFDVIGNASVPEPTTALLSALGIFGLFRRRR